DKQRPNVEPGEDEPFRESGQPIAHCRIGARRPVCGSLYRGQQTVDLMILDIEAAEGGQRIVAGRLEALRLLEEPSVEAGQRMPALPFPSVWSSCQCPTVLLNEPGRRRAGARRGVRTARTR